MLGQKNIQTMKKGTKLSAAIKGQLQIKRFIIPYRVCGNGGPHLVCLNGIQQSMAMWHSFIRRFSSKYRIVLFDFPGQGKGRVLSGSTKTALDEEVEILEAVIEAAGVNDITLCTASWGGVVAMMFAERSPQIVRRLILGSLGTRANKQMKEIIQNGTRFHPNDREKISDSMITTFGQNLPEVIKRKIKKQFAEMSQERLSAFCEHGLFIIDGKNLRDVVNFKGIQAETILLRGENDAIVDLDDVQYLTSQIPNCRMELIQDVGHFLHMESNDVLDIYSKILAQQ
jgi:pimeloyl-ACP methyl ester carboxylesterase